MPFYRKTTEVVRSCDEDQKGAHIVRGMLDADIHLYQEKEEQAATPTMNTCL